MPELTDKVSKDDLRDIFYIWFYVTVAHLDDIRPVDGTKEPVSADILIANLEQEAAQIIKMTGDKKLTDDNKNTLNAFYDAVKNNKEFRRVREALTKDDRLKTPWSGGGLHPTPYELSSVFITPGSE
jgi:hypothetical protein